jgi:hypothetical protein
MLSARTGRSTFPAPAPAHASASRAWCGRYPRAVLRRIVALFTLGLAVAVLSGCQLRLAVEIDVDRDGAGNLALTVGADADLLARAEAAGAHPLDDLAAAVDALDGWRVAEHSDDDGGRTVTVSARFADPAAFATLTAELASALAAPEAVLLDPLTVEVSVEQVQLSGGAGLVPTEHVTELGLLPDDAVRLAREQDAIHYTVVATMPGEVLSTTADDVDGRRAVWLIEPGAHATLHAVSERPPDRLPAMVAGGLLGAVAAGLVGLLVVRRVRRRRLPAQP